MQRQTKGYALILLLFSVLGLLIYGAYSPARKAQKQQIICFSFKKDIKSQAVERHFHEFASLKHQIPQIVSYTAGKTFMAGKVGAEYDVMHYLTFQSTEDITAFEHSAAYKQFILDNQASWGKTLVINADIQP